MQSLGYTWDEVHEEACRLEHVISEDFEARMAAALGHPTHDPHGDPIPDAELVMPSDDSPSAFILRPHAGRDHPARQRRKPGTVAPLG